MDEENTEQAEGSEQPEGEPHGDEPRDWKAAYDELSAAHDKLKAASRKWESRSKANAATADEATERAEAAESEISQLRAEAERTRTAMAVAEETGVPASLITAADEESMRAQADAIMAFAESRPSAPVFRSDGTKPKGKAKSPKDDFAAFMQDIQR